MEYARIMVKKRGELFVLIDLSWVSIDARILGEKLGINTHTASAYLLGLRFLAQMN